MIEHDFDRFRRHVAELLPDNPPFLPGATDAELARLESGLGFRLPDELRAMLATANGQDRRVSPDGPIDGHRFMTTTEILETHQSLERSVWDLAHAAEQPGYFSDDVLSPLWVPFTELVDQHHMVDLAPGRLGTRGQVLVRYNAPEPLPPAAPSLAAFLRSVNEGIDSGAFEVEDGTFITVA